MYPFEKPSLKIRLILIVLLGHVLLRGDNAVKNGDFENGEEGWITWGGQISGELQYKGSFGAGIYSHEPARRGLHQKLHIPQNARTFTIKVMMKTDEVIGGKENWESALISVLFIDEVDSVVGGYPPRVAMVRGSSDWTMYSRTYSVNFMATYIKIVLALWNSTGSVQFDDVSLIFFDEDGNELDCNDLSHKEHVLVSKQRKASNRLVNPDFANGMVSWQGTEAMHSGNGGVENSACLRLGMSSNEKWAVQKVLLTEKVRRIVVTGYIATENVNAGRKFWECANIGGEFLDEKDIRIGNYLEPAGNVSGTTAMKEYSIIYQPRAGAVSMRIICGMNGKSGIARFDNLKVSFFDAEGNEVDSR